MILIKILKYLAEKEKKVTTNEYITWLYAYVKAHETLSDSDLFYNSEQDRINAKRLTNFINYVISLAQEQRVLSITKDYYELINYCIKIDDSYFEIESIYLEKIIIFVRPTKKPNYCYVVVR